MKQLQKPSHLDFVLFVVVALAPAEALVVVNPVRGLSLRPVIWVALLAIFLGWWLARGAPGASPAEPGHGRAGWKTHAAVVGLGVLGALWLTLQTIPAPISPDGTPPPPFWSEAQLAGELGAWLQSAVARHVLIDDHLFFLLCLGLAWLLGYPSGWLVGRRREVWLPVAAGVVLLAVVLTSYPGLGWYAPIQLIAAVILLGRTNRAMRWKASDNLPSASILERWEGVAGVGLAVGLVAVGWFAPTALTSRGVAEASTLARDDWSRLSSLKLGHFASADPSIGGFGAMTFHGAFHLSDSPVLKIVSPRPADWRAVVYDQYTGSGWKTSPSTTSTLSPDENLRVPLDLNRAPLVQQVTILAARGSYLVGASNPVKFDRPAALQTFPFGSAVDLLSAQAKLPLLPGMTYSVTSEVSTASVNQLRQAGTAYPPEVAARYRSLPALPWRVRRLAWRLTVDQSNPYDKAEAIDAYLHTLTYSEQVAAPPPGRDGVDYFLFDTRAGYCDYFASAMAVMLRSVGVPARVVSGYATGEVQSDGSYLVRDASAHSWTEVYFPGYGWIPFDPTPGWSDPPRGAQNAPPPSAPEVVPPATASTQVLNGPSEALQEAPGSVEATARWAEGRPASFLGILTAVIVVGAAGIGMLLWRRDVAGLPAPVEVYVRMVRLATVLGRGPRPSETPEEYARNLSRRVPEAAEGIERIAAAYGGFVFGRRPGQGDDLPGWWRRVRDAFLRHALRLPAR